MKHTRYVILPALTLLIMLLSACGSSTSNVTTSQAAKAPTKQQILVFPIGGVRDVATLDPPLISEVYSAEAEGMLFNGMYTYNDQSKMVPDLATSYELSADGLRWTFHLRPNLKFSDGSLLTSADVVYSIDRSLQPSLKSPFAYGELAEIKDADKLNDGKIKTLIGDSLLTPDPQTVVIVTSKPAAFFMDLVGSWAVVEKSFVEKYGSHWTDHLSEGGVAGPWKLQSWSHNKSLTFVPNPYYYGPKPQLQKLVMPLYVESDTTYKDYQVNRVDFSFVPPVNVEAAKKLSDGQFRVDPSLGNAFVAMNYLVKPFDNLKVRQAFDLAINRELLASKVWHNTVLPTYHTIPQGAQGYNPNLANLSGNKSLAGDPVRAKQLFMEGLQEEGMTPATMPPIHIEVTVAGEQSLSDQWAVLQQMWNTALGISVKIDVVDFNKLVTDINGSHGNKNVMADALGWQASPDPHSWTTLMFDPSAGSDYSNYGYNPEQRKVLADLAKADENVKNAAERLQEYDQVERELENDVAWIVLYQDESLCAVKPCVVGWPHNVFGQFGIPYQPDWGNIYISTQPNCANTSSYQ
ncbi:peptide ABC transporter substrate-binding protein [Ktedonosporobacter rubrisoli]|uniref:Peptide ABC transporter substrate-binding protein n=1 Tax=Ktedonosporobacter rubrisoli TaxID=2509675 RepID=A0A4P6JQM7_KTERU|nr:peptide ABC transporter substrate-binding protein [Ktedonosporobacter rubrisoli]QBD77066.1 peptide ABC transporter substrate-binding protein [Ktedonosporobacter rubrisoli]